MLDCIKCLCVLFVVVIMFVLVVSLTMRLCVLNCASFVYVVFGCCVVSYVWCLFVV